MIAALFLFFRPDFAAALDERLKIGNGGGLRLTADRMELDPAKKTLSANGNVQLDTEGLRLSADSLSYDVETGVIKAVGSVHAVNGANVLSAEELSVQLEGISLVIVDAVLIIKDEPPLDGGLPVEELASRGRNRVLLKGARIERVGKGRFEVLDGSFTPCDCGPGKTPSWSISCRSADIVEGDAAYLKRPVFYIRETPVFILPAAEAPLARRRTGLLPPEMSYGEGLGFRLKQDIFYKIDDRNDATFGMDGMTEKGIGPRLEYRNFSNGSTRSINAFYLADAEGASPEISRHRFAISQESSWYPIRGVRNKVRMEIYSDANMPSDFERNWRERSRDFSRSNFQLHSEEDDFFIGAEIARGQRLFDPVERDGWLWTKNASTEMFALPTARISLPPLVLMKGWLLFSSDATFGYFYRPSDDPDTLGSGKSAFAKAGNSVPAGATPAGGLGEPVARSGRLAFQPRLTVPIRFSDAAIFQVDGGWTHRFFFMNHERGKEEYEGYFDIGALAETRLYRVFEYDSGGAVKHEIAPSLSWRYVPRMYSSERASPERLFYLSPLDDRIAPHRATASIEQRLAYRNGDTGMISRFLTFRLSQRVFIDEETKERLDTRLDEGTGELGLHAPKASLSASLGYRHRSETPGSAATWLDVGPFHGGRLMARYRYIPAGPMYGAWLFQRKSDLDERIHQVGAEPSWTFFEALTVSYAVDLSVIGPRLIEQAWGLGYRSPCRCWSAALSVIHRPELRTPDVFLTVDLTTLVNETP